MDPLVLLLLGLAFVLGWLLASGRRLRRAAMLLGLLGAALALWLCLLWIFRRRR
jgi:hypothetical protein